MSDLLAITYPDQHRGAEVFASLQRMKAERFIDLADAVYVTKDYRGRIKLHQEVSLVGANAPHDAMWKTLIGVLFAALAIGRGGKPTERAATKAFALGIDQKFIKHLGINLPPGSSAIFVLLRKATLAEIMPEVDKYGGSALHSPLAPEAEQCLYAASDPTKP
jgi:uncharacterized membrane protein